MSFNELNFRQVKPRKIDGEQFTKNLGIEKHLGHYVTDGKY